MSIGLSVLGNEHWIKYVGLKEMSVCWIKLVGHRKRVYGYVLVLKLLKALANT